MKKLLQGLLLCLPGLCLQAQVFTRSELPTALNTPWEIIYGPDGFLWLSEFGGKVSRVDPATGAKTVVFTAPDYFGGSAAEQSTLCFQPPIGVGTLGMALHPDFTNSSTSFIYLVYSYNSGTAQAPATKFKIERLTWDATSSTVTSNTTVVSLMPTGYDHQGGRLMAIKQNNVPYLFLTIGDNGVSDINSPDCYQPQSNNPNLHAQDPNYKNGKVHRFNIDGSIPATNPIAGNSFYTRGHRNPQGLAFNDAQNIIYEIEHGDQTDDEINILQAGMNYGWKNVRGYHSDNNFPGEASYISNYVPNAAIANDALKEPMFAWCAVPQPTSTNGLDWCTVAPSGAIYYNSNGIPEWSNSLLVVTLKNGVSTDQELYQLKLSADGKTFIPSTANDPNPKRFFGADQATNGRLRDIAVSPDGTKIYLVNNGGANADKITVYTYDATASIATHSLQLSDLQVYPNPTADVVDIRGGTETIQRVEVYDLVGKLVRTENGNISYLSTNGLAKGSYFLKIYTTSGKAAIKRIIKD